MMALSPLTIQLPGCVTLVVSTIQNSESGDTRKMIDLDKLAIRVRVSELESDIRWLGAFSGINFALIVLFMIIFLWVK